jgi:hypothetical protein
MGQREPGAGEDHSHGACQDQVTQNSQGESSEGIDSGQILGDDSDGVRHVTLPEVDRPLAVIRARSEEYRARFI